MPIETFYISSYSTHNKQQVVSKLSAHKKGKKVITATNMCSKFGGFRCSPLDVSLFGLTGLVSGGLFIVANFPEGDSRTFMCTLSTWEILTTPTN